MSNTSRGPISVILRIETDQGGFVVLSHEFQLDRGQQQTMDVSMRPGLHQVVVSASNGVFERTRIEIPERGDTTIEFVVSSASVTIQTTS